MLEALQYEKWKHNMSHISEYIALFISKNYNLIYNSVVPHITI